MIRLVERAIEGVLTRWRRSTHGARAVVLVYHRIAEPDSDPLGLCVSPAYFAEHLQVVRKFGVALRLESLPAALEDNRSFREGVCVTFDDGYADTLHTAIPLLQRYDIPATVFVVSGQHARKREFWWDEIGRLLFGVERLPTTALPTALFIPRRTAEESRADRRAMFKLIHDRLYNMPADDREAALERLRAWVSALSVVRPTHATLCPADLRCLADSGLVEIGAHTVTHPSLDRLNNASQRAEMLGSKHFLQDAVGRPVTSFAYPHGRYTQETVRLAREVGFDRACTVAPGIVSDATNPWQLPRILVSNIDGDALTRWLRHLFRQRAVRVPHV